MDSEDNPWERLREAMKPRIPVLNPIAFRLQTPLAAVLDRIGNWRPYYHNGGSISFVGDRRYMITLKAVRR